MIIRLNNEIGEILVGNLPISAVYVGSSLVWTLDNGTVIIGSSCFSSGIWDDNLPWLDDDIWKDEP